MDDKFLKMINDYQMNNYLNRIHFMINHQIRLDN